MYVIGVRVTPKITKDSKEKLPLPGRTSEDHVTRAIAVSVFDSNGRSIVSVTRISWIYSLLDVFLFFSLLFWCEKFKLYKKPFSYSVHVVYMHSDTHRHLVYRRHQTESARDLCRGCHPPPHQNAARVETGI